VVIIPLFPLEEEYIYINLFIFHMIIIQPESTLQTGFCNKIELGYFVLIIFYLSIFMLCSYEEYLHLSTSRKPDYSLRKNEKN